MSTECCLTLTLTLTTEVLLSAVPFVVRSCTIHFSAKEELIRYKFRWTDADAEPMDNALTREEFMSFRHPEQSEKTLNNMVISIMSGIGECHPALRVV